MLVALVLALAGIGAAVVMAGRGGSVGGGEPSATNFYPLFGSNGVDLNDPYLSGSLVPGPSGRELPSIGLADAEGGRPEVARLRITDVQDVDTSQDFVPVTVHGREGFLRAGKDTIFNYATGEDEPIDWATSTLVWPVADGLWAVLETTLRPDEKPAEATRRIADGVTFVGRDRWTDRFPFRPTPTEPAPVDLDTTTSSSIAGAGGGDQPAAVSTTAGP